ncbi:hypothetical protein HGRIS_012075 [Hohenbuehelia grisea]|uniref:F-box domain-containing protein n=1 Tax=Hohenbuehelia grisea TaxID=104357 RepID=A0ABR3IR75_9AGAR
MDSKTGRRGPIPQDVIDTIIDAISDQDQRTLRTLALVNVSCLITSRRRAFPLIRLRTHNAHAFLRLLESPLCTLKHCKSTVVIHKFDFDHPDEDTNDENQFLSLSQGHRWLAIALALPPHTFAFAHHLFIDFGYYSPEISQTLTEQLPLIFPTITSLSVKLGSARAAAEIAAAPRRSATSYGKQDWSAQVQVSGSPARKMPAERPQALGVPCHQRRRRVKPTTHANSVVSRRDCAGLQTRRVGVCGMKHAGEHLAGSTVAGPRRESERRRGLPDLWTIVITVI